MDQVKCSIQILGDKEVFRPGETITGIVILKIEEELKISNIVIYCRGQALTKLYRHCQDQGEVTGLENYLNQELLLLSDSSPVALTAGEYTYKFNFLLPSEGLPSSFEGSHGAVRYWLELELQKLPPGSNVKFVGCFTVLAHLDVGEKMFWQVVQSSTSRSLLEESTENSGEPAGTYALSARLNGTGYCPGEEMSVHLEVTSKGPGECGHVTVSLVQQVEYHAGSESVYTVQTVRTQQGNKLDVGKTGISADSPLLVDAVPPSTLGRSCQIIKVSYYIMVTVAAPVELELKIPVTVGTIPALAGQACHSSHGSSDLQALNYMRCQLGVEAFSWSEGTFLNPTHYTPLTVFINTCSPVKSAVTTLQKQAEALHITEAAPVTTKTSAAKEQEEIASTKVPPLDETDAKQLYLDRKVPSAPPMDATRILEAPPPSYDQACAAPKEVVPVPYYVPLQTGKGCVLLLQFPCLDATSVGDCFKRNVPNTLLHEGKVLAFIPEIDFFPSIKTSALIIYFGAERTAHSWLNNMISFSPELASNWWALTAENKTETKKPGDLNKYKIISITLLKQKADFVRTKDYTEEYARLAKEGVVQAKKKHGVLNIVSGKLVFACGDWSSFPAKVSELTINITQYEDVEHRKAYIQEYINDSKLRRFNEMRKESSEFLFIGGFPTGDIWRFQDL